MTTRKLRERSPRKALPAKKRSDRVDKRPARGYHTFKNGALNVTPKGSEKDIVESNQDSPLLRLPAEIRNIIWTYALGGKTIRQVIRGRSKYVFVPEASEKTNAFALLGTCRQIYAESVHLPFAGNTFSVQHLFRFGKCFKSFKTHQLSHIKEVNIEISAGELGDGTTFNYFQYCFQHTKFDLLPELRRIRLCLFPFQRTKFGSIAEAEKSLRKLVERTLESKQYDLVVQRMDMDSREFTRRWFGN